MNNVFDILASQGYNNLEELKNYYSKHVSVWDKWWRGYVSSFHDYYVTNVQKSTTLVKRKSLKMAKTVCEDWANMLLNDKTFIKVDDENGQKFLTGDKEEQNGGVLGLSKFWKYGNRTIEKEYALGTCAFILDLVNPKLSSNELKADNVRIKCIKETGMIIPLSWDDDEIYECAFCSYKSIEKNQYLFIKKMLKYKKGYKIINEFYIKKDGMGYTKTNSPDGTVYSYILPCKPFFILMPAIENNIIEDNIPIGISCFANAIDQLQGVDIAYDNIFNDFVLGRKKVHINEDALAMEEKHYTDENGEDRTEKKVAVGDTLEQSLYVNMGERLPGEEILFKEYNPLLRVEENEKGIQLFLNLISSKVGFGNHKYRFDRVTMTTATEVKSNNKDLVESVWKHRIVIQDVLTEMTRSILILGKEICGIDVNPDAKISIQFDETMFTDEEVERMRFLQEINAGVRQKWEYRTKYLGEDEVTAKSMVKVETDQGLEYGS